MLLLVLVGCVRLDFLLLLLGFFYSPQFLALDFVFFIGASQPVHAIPLNLAIPALPKIYTYIGRLPLRIPLYPIFQPLRALRDHYSRYMCFLAHKQFQKIQNRYYPHYISFDTLATAILNYLKLFWTQPRF